MFCCMLYGEMACFKRSSLAPAVRPWQGRKSMSKASSGGQSAALLGFLNPISLSPRLLDQGKSNDGRQTADVAAPGVPKKRTFKKFSFRGVDLDALLDMSTDELVKLFPARARRRLPLVIFSI
ncbi:40S ribosomal protein S15 [Hibiscus syriacus]|uniref:40S ribosomal protein S15 n=1 Tax=Hibiscus syriacus TaxID=106335 RepID=A0A6A2X1Y5_HIBSY|nr:40S ribosomal protein S15 [Hibiscus syriacus]